MALQVRGGRHFFRRDRIDHKLVGWAGFLPMRFRLRHIDSMGKRVAHPTYRFDLFINPASEARFRDSLVAYWQRVEFAQYLASVGG